LSRILVSGLCPLPHENTPKSYGPGIRTWQLASGLARGGHEVRVIAMRIGDAYPRGARGADREIFQGIEIERLDEGPFLGGDEVANAARSGWPEAVVGATIYGSHALARRPPVVPFWADQFGHVMAEAQAKAALDGNDNVLPYFWRLLEPVLVAADRISTVSERQRWAAVGELGAVGRLTAATCGYEFTAVLPCAYVGQPTTGISCRPGELRRALGIPDDAFVVLWSGSFNVWSDVETLFRGLEQVMRERPLLHFVATGGEIPGHDETSYKRLLRLAENSPWRLRFHFRGWLPADEVLAHQQAADLGVLAEQAIYEGALGSKNRIVQWLGGGLPVLYNRVGELGELLADEGLGLTFEVGRSDQLAAQVGWAADHPAELAALAARAGDYAATKLTFEATTAPLVAWAERPVLAPDRRAASGDQAARGFVDAARPSGRELVQAIGQVPFVRRSQLVRRLWRWIRRQEWLSGA